MKPKAGSSCSPRLAPPALDEEVARVQVGVEEAVLEDHLEDEPGAPVGQGGAIHAGGLKRGAVGDLAPDHPLQREDPRGGRLPAHTRDVYQGIAREVAGEAL